MDRRVLVDSITKLLLSVQSTSPERARDLFRGLAGRDGFVPQLTRWLDKSRNAFPEPFTTEDLDSLHDPGIDVLVIGERSGARIGFQVKSDNDLRPESFTRDLKAQILDAQNIGIEQTIIIFACSPTKQNISKIKYWQNHFLDRPEILCLLPERA